MKNTKINLSNDVYLKITRKGYLTYIYNPISSDCEFRLTLLSEVGQSIEWIYEKFFEENGYKVKTVEFDEKPYLQDRIVNYHV